MGVEVAIAAVGLGISAAGAYKQYEGQKQTAAAEERRVTAQQQAEAARQRQLNLDAMRRQRETVRQYLQMRAQSLAVATAQGASGDGGSAVPGAYGQHSGQTNVNSLGIRQNQEIGNEMFDYNQDVLSSYRDSAAGTQKAALGAGLTSLGGMLMQNAGVIARIGGGVYPGYNYAGSGGNYEINRVGWGSKTPSGFLGGGV